MTDEEPTTSRPGQDDEKKWQYPLIKMSDLPEDTQPEIIEMIAGTVERHSSNISVLCKTLKENLDTVYGPRWNVIVGEGFGFDVTFLKKHVLHIFIGNLGILVWKNS